MFSAIELSIATRRCSSTNETHLRIPHRSTVRTANDASAAKRRSSSTYETLLHIPLRPSSVRPAIDLSATKRRSSSTCGILPFTSRIRKPLWTSSSTLSQRFNMTLLSHQLRPMPNLRTHEGWRRGDPASKDAWNRYQDALASELRKWYGAENDMAAWHALCRAIGVKPLPRTCEQCEEV